jgi:hypothetical protein
MLVNKKALVLALLCASSLFSCGGCPARQSRPQGGETADAGPSSTSVRTYSIEELEIEGERFLVDERFELSDGIKDTTNQYAFTVMTGVRAMTGRPINCSGVFISPRLVLTAGHCVCERRKTTEPHGEVKSIIDGSACARDATVTFVTYHPRQESTDTPESTQGMEYEGEVRFHPELKVLLDAQSLVVSSHADLAVISLREPAEDSVPSVHLADSEVEVGDFITMAGYGQDATTDLIYGVRRFGRKRVTRVPSAGSDGVMFDSEGGFAYTSGSGEPCLRQDGKEQRLFGISSMGLGDKPSCTSLHIYRDWLRSEMQRAMKVEQGQ